MIDINNLVIENEVEISTNKNSSNDKCKNESFDKNLDEIEKEDTSKNEKEKNIDNLENISINLMKEILKNNLLINNININEKNSLMSENINGEMIDLNKYLENTNEKQENTCSIDVQYLNSKIESNELLEKLSKLDSSIYDANYRENTEQNIEAGVDDLTINNRIEINDDINILGNISKGINNRNELLSEISKGENFATSNIEQNNIEETIKNIKIMKSEDIKELVVKLRPRELGDMHIKLVQENGNMKAILSLEDNDAFKMLNKNISELKSHMENFNVKQIEIVVKADNAYSSDSFDKSFDEYRGNEEHSHNKKRSKQNETDDSILEVESENIASLNSSINLLA